MNKHEIVGRITECGVVAVVRADSGEQAVRIAEACAEGGVAALEITYTVAGASKIIEELAGRYQNSGFIVGAGTVLDSETARVAILAGAQYVVSPCLQEQMMRLCNRYAVPGMPGVMTLRDAVEGLELGADILKLFPGEAFGPGIIKSLKGPLPQANFMPTGGVDLDNVDLWIEGGAVAVGVGGSLTAPARKGDYKAVRQRAEQFVKRVKEARAQ